MSTVSTVTAESPVLTPTVPDRVERGARKEASRGWTSAWKLLEGLAHAGACFDPSGVLAMQRIREDTARQWR
jgi:hypothetical protein